MSKPLILASGSAIRAQILRGAGLSFEIRKPDVDEAQIKAEMAGEDPQKIAMALAAAKARAVDSPGALVIGSDQILEFEDEIFDKPASRDEARARLLSLAGKTHSLINAVAVAEDGEIVFTHLDRPRLAMRDFSQEEIDAYLDRAGDGVLSSVGAYQVEGLGANLFERIDGDYFSVLGLSLFPLLGFLRQRGAAAF